MTTVSSTIPTFYCAPSRDQSDSIAAIAKALCVAQGEFGLAELDGENPHFGSKFSTLKSLHKATREALVKNGLAVTHTTDLVDGNMLLITTMMHASGEWIKGRYPVFQGRGPQDTKAATTYAKRAAYAAITGVADEAGDDDDGNAVQEAAKQSRANTQQQRQENGPPTRRSSAAYKQQQQANPMSMGEQQMRDEINRLLQEMCGGDQNAIIEELETQTGFTGKKGDWVKGVTSTAALKDRRLEVTLDKVRKAHAKWQQGDDSEPWAGGEQG